MKNKMMMISAKSNMIAQFNMRNISILQKLGFEVHVGANFKEYGTIDSKTNQSLMETLTSMGVVIHQLNFSRGLGAVRNNKVVVSNIRKIMKQNDFTFIHVHSPIGSVLGRIAAHKEAVRVVYTAHGFHFFRGGPIKNWIFFPVEWILMFFTDHLVVINKGDLAVSKWLPIKRVTYIPSVGANVDSALAVSYSQKQSDRLKIRNELDISEHDYVILNVGEFSERKNQTTLIKAIAQLPKSIHIKILFAGVTNDRSKYTKIVSDLGLTDKVLFLGYRSDLPALHHAADLLVMPSLREGFGMGGFDALVDGVYMIGSKNTGMADYLKDESLGRLVNPNDVIELSNSIVEAYNGALKPDLRTNEAFLKQFDKKNVDAIMTSIYAEYLN